MNQAENFNIELFNDIVKDIRNAHRKATSETNDIEFLEKQKAALQKDIEAAARTADIDTVSAKSQELRRVLNKIKDGPQSVIEEFNTAYAKLEAMVNGEPVEMKKAA